MDQKNRGTTAYQRAYRAWFEDHEAERLRRHKRKGSKLTDFPGPPTCPEDIAKAVDAIGPRRVLAALEIHRSTLARWLSGDSVIPRPAWLVLVMMAEGRLPGMSADWRGFRFDGDTLQIVGTRYAWTAREIAGWPYQLQHARALADRIRQLEKEKAHLLKTGHFEAANDPLISNG